MWFNDGYQLHDGSYLFIPSLAFRLFFRLLVTFETLVVESLAPVLPFHPFGIFSNLVVTLL